MKLSNVVHVTTALERRHPNVFGTIKSACESHAIQFRVIDCTNLWIRDWMPVPCRYGLVKFGYKGYPGGNYEQYPQLQVPEECWQNLTLPVGLATRLTLDGGGNCVRSEHTAVVTDVVYQHNPSHSPLMIRQMLETVLGLDVLVIPREPDDELGHADGIVKFIGNDCVFMNDYWHNGSHRESAYGTGLFRCLERAGIYAIPFPFGYGRDGFPKISKEEFRQRFPDGDDWNPAVGYYINFLHVEGLVLLPAFGHTMDDQAARKIEEYLPDVDVVQVDCSALCNEGGLVNCVTWDIRE